MSVLSFLPIGLAFGLLWISSGARRLASVTAAGMTSSIVMAGALVMILMSSFGWNEKKFRRMGCIG